MTEEIDYAEQLFFNHYRDNRGSHDSAPFFDNQKKLIKKLNHTNRNYLMSAGVNVLTIRLLLAQDALSKMKDYELAIKQKPGQYEESLFSVIRSNRNQSKS